MTRDYPKNGEVWHHFKGHDVKIVANATHTETNEPMVCYICQNQYWVRPLDMFMSEVDRNKHPDVKQKYRFEKVDEELSVGEILESWGAKKLKGLHFIDGYDWSLEKENKG